MLDVDIPGFGNVRLKYLVSDYTGTLSLAGKLLPGVKGLLNRIAATLEVHVVTADTFGLAQAELAGVECRVHITAGASEDVLKEEYVRTLGTENVIAIGNGNNDRKMLAAARIGIAVCQQEGCARDTVLAADILMTSIRDALELVLNEKMLKATLRS